MNWLDSVLAIPSIGLGLSGKISHATRLREILLPFIEDRYKVRQVSFPQHSPIETYIELDTGYRIKADHQRLFVEFQYSVTGDAVPGSFILPKPPERQAFSAMLETELAMVKDLWKEIHKNADGIRISFLGIVANAFLSKGDLPPGIETFFEHLRKPWPLGLWAGDGNFIAILDKTETEIHRCHHRFNAPFHAENGEYTFVFDYQQVFSQPTSVSDKQMSTYLSDLQTTALAYYERFAAGSLNYE